MPQSYFFTIFAISGEGPIARAYLEMLYSLRCKPRRIIHLIAKRDLVTQKTVGTFLPLFLRNKYSAIVQARKIHYWPKYLFRIHNKLCMEVIDQLSETLKIEYDALLGTIKLRPLDHYCDNIISFPINSMYLSLTYRLFMSLRTLLEPA